MTRKLNVREYYNQYAANYDNFYKPIQLEKFNQFSSEIPYSSILFDLGGGSGIVSDWIDLPLVNLDLSTDMLWFGSKSREFLGIACDLEHLPLRREVIDVFVSLTAIQNVENIVDALIEIKRCLNKRYIGYLTLLKKKIKYDVIFSALKSNIGSNIENLSYSGEDYIFKLQN